MMYVYKYFQHVYFCAVMRRCKRVSGLGFENSPVIWFCAYHTVGHLMGIAPDHETTYD